MAYNNGYYSNDWYDLQNSLLADDDLSVIQILTAQMVFDEAIQKWYFDHQTWENLKVGRLIETRRELIEL